MEKKWNPLYSRTSAASATESTGSIPVLPEDAEQAESYDDLFPGAHEIPVSSPAQPQRKKPQS